MPRVSIILTVEKDRGWLDESIRSALNQTYDDYEVILACDGNPNLVKYAKKYGINFVLSPKGNQQTNFNSGARHAQGEFLKPLHDDDMLTENCLSDLVGSIGDHAIVHANAINFGANMKDQVYKPKFEPKFNRLIKMRSSYIHAETIMFRSDIFWKLGGYDESLIYMEDYDYYLNLLSHGYTFAYCDSVVVKYRKHPGQLSWVPVTPARERDKNYIISKYEFSNMGSSKR